MIDWDGLTRGDLTCEARQAARAVSIDHGLAVVVLCTRGHVHSRRTFMRAVARTVHWLRSEEQ